MGSAPDAAPGAGAARERRNARYTPLAADGPLPLDMIRAVPVIRGDPLTFLAGVVRQYGDLVAFPMPRTPVLLVNDPAGASHVLQAGHRGYGKATVQYRSLAGVTGDGLLTSDGEQWRRSRRIARPGFQALQRGLRQEAHQAAHHATNQAAHQEVPPGVHHAANLQAVVVREATAAGERLRADWDAAGGGPFDVAAASLRATLGLVGRTFFADDLAAEGAGIVEAVDVALHALVRRAASPFGVGPLGRLPTPARRRLEAAVTALDAAIWDVVARRRRRGASPADTDVLALLLRAADRGELSGEQVRDELVTLIIAGHETVASCLTWTLYLLAGTPSAQDRLQTERDQPQAGSARPAAPQGMRFTSAVVDEALRLYPPAWMISRRALAPDTVAGVDVPAGTLLLISPWLLHRRAQDWPDPERFDPARFLGERVALPGAAGYLPFGAGPRLCIGRDVARAQVTHMLLTILRDRIVALPDGARPPRVDALVTLRPHGGLPLVLNPRVPASPRGGPPSRPADRPPATC